MASTPDPRALKKRVKTARGRTASSTRWLERHLNDPYVHRAKVEGYRSRAAYKLIEIDDRHSFLKRGSRLVDLGAAPGGWSQVAAQRLGSSAARPLVVALDRLAMEPLPGVTLLRKDFMDEDAPQAIIDALGDGPGPAGGRVSVVLSDLAASTTGHRRTDHLRTMQLCEAALEFAEDVLAPGGTFLAKVFQGGTEGELLARMRRRFAAVRHVKPGASRSASPELYVLATGFR